MAEVVVGDADGLAGMLGALLSAAVEQPAKAALLDTMRGTVTIVAPDADVAVGLRFGNGVCRVASGPIPGSAVRIEMPSETLLGLPSIPLLYGLPSVLTAEGRAFTLALARRDVRIAGLVRHLTLVRQVTTLLSVA